MLALSFVDIAGSDGVERGVVCCCWPSVDVEAARREVKLRLDRVDCGRRKAAIGEELVVNPVIEDRRGIIARKKLLGGILFSQRRGSKSTVLGLLDEELDRGLSRFAMETVPGAWEMSQRDKSNKCL